MNARKTKKKTLRSELRTMKAGQEKRYPVKRYPYVRVTANFLKRKEGLVYTTYIDWERNVIVIKRK